MAELTMEEIRDQALIDAKLDVIAMCARHGIDDAQAECLVADIGVDVIPFTKRQKSKFDSYVPIGRRLPKEQPVIEPAIEFQVVEQRESMI